jgi:hypothetical protein
MPDRLRNKIDAAMRLTREEWGLFLRAWWLLLLMDWELRRKPYLEVVKRKGWRAADRRQETGDWRGIIQPAVKMVGVAARNHVRPMTCLRQSLALQRLLWERGVDTELKFGVRKMEGELQAHAWLEWEGEPVGDMALTAGEFAVLNSK